MDLIYTTCVDNPTDNPYTDSFSTFVPASISSQNTLVFVVEEKSVFVCDLNTPWDTHLITLSKFPVSLVSWNGRGTSVLVGDSNGEISLWSSVNYILNDWKKDFSYSFSQEIFISSKFFSNIRRVFVNNEKHESTTFYNEKFITKVRSDVHHHHHSGFILISRSGLIVAIISTPYLEKTFQIVSSSLGRHRSRLKCADIAYMKDDKLLGAISNGDPNCPIKTLRISPEFSSFSNTFSLVLTSFVDIFLSKDNYSSSSIRELHFINKEDSDGLLIGIGGKVEMWELQDSSIKTHKMLAKDNCVAHNFPTWKYVEAFRANCSILKICTPDSRLVVGKSLMTPSCYIILALSDGSIQIILRDSLVQIERIDLVPLNPRRRIRSFESDKPCKSSRNEVIIANLCFTATGNGLVVLDSLSQIYCYRMSPISDPGGCHTVPYVVTMFEHCMMSGKDFWDLLLCCKASMVEAICDKLTENFNRQPSSQPYFTQYMAIKTSLYRLSCGTEYKASDCYALQMLTSLYGTFKSFIRPLDLSEQLSSLEKITMILQSSQKSETDIDKIIKTLESIQKDFRVDPGVLQSFQQLIQWTTNLILYYMASIPDFTSRRGPGIDVVGDKKLLGALRELLVLIRLWGSQCPSSLPVFTRTTESLDVIAQLFSLLTRTRENHNDESLIEDSLALVSQILIPPLNLELGPRGFLSSRSIPVSYTFNEEPSYSLTSNSFDSEGHLTNTANSSSNGTTTSTTTQMIDSIRSLYLGRSPGTLKECTRCLGVTLPHSSGSKSTLVKSWDKRWLKNCPCGGHWIIRVMTSSFSTTVGGVTAGVTTTTTNGASVTGGGNGTDETSTDNYSQHH